MAHSRHDVKPVEAAAPIVLKKKKKALAQPAPGLPQDAIKSELPAALKPQLATLVDGPPNVDGEVIVPNENGIPDFQSLQNAFDSSRTQSIIYYVFDVPFHGGYDLRSAPLWLNEGKTSSIVRDARNGYRPLQRNL